MTLLSSDVESRGLRTGQRLPAQRIVRQSETAMPRRQSRIRLRERAIVAIDTRRLEKLRRFLMRPAGVRSGGDALVAVLRGSTAALQARRQAFESPPQVTRARNVPGRPAILGLIMTSVPAVPVEPFENERCCWCADSVLIMASSRNVGPHRMRRTVRRGACNARANEHARRSGRVPRAPTLELCCVSNGARCRRWPRRRDIDDTKPPPRESEAILSQHGQTAIHGVRTGRRRNVRPLCEGKTCESPSRCAASCFDATAGSPVAKESNLFEWVFSGRW